MNNKRPEEDDTRKLAFVVAYMSMFIIVLFSLAPFV